MKLTDLLEILPFKANIELIIKQDSNSNTEYIIRFDLGTYKFMRGIKDAPYTCPFEKYKSREVDKINTYNIVDNIAENYTIKNVYRVTLKPETKDEKNISDNTESLDISLNLKLPTYDMGTSALVRKKNEISIVKRGKITEESTYHKITIDNNLREEFFADIKRVRGENTKIYKVCESDLTSDLFKKWDDIMNSLYKERAQKYINNQEVR